MITYVHLQSLASDLLFVRDPTEVHYRRAVSTLYYALFHRLTAMGARCFMQGGWALQNQATRAYSHQIMRKTCERYTRSPGSPFKPPLEALSPVPPDPRIVEVADAFVRLQEGRHAADYDLGTTFTLKQVSGLVAADLLAHKNLDEVAHLPETTIFLTALLLDDKWTRRG